MSILHNLRNKANNGSSHAVNISSDIPKYKGFRKFNQAPIGSLASSRSSIKPHLAERHFNSDSLPDRFVHELAKQHALPTKEILESFEFFVRVRKHVRAPQISRPVLRPRADWHPLRPLRTLRRTRTAHRSDATPEPRQSAGRRHPRRAVGRRQGSLSDRAHERRR